MSYHKPKKPKTINEWRKYHTDLGDVIAFQKVTKSGKDKSAIDVLAKFDTDNHCPWCNSKLQYIEKYNFVFFELEYSFMGCKRFPLCDWTSDRPEPIMKF